MGATKKQEKQITISPPNFQRLEVTIIGTAPLLQARFGEKAKQAMMSKMAAGSTAKKGKKRAARNFDEDFEQAQHKSTEGWIGVPASALRNACIDACRMAGFAMTRAKMSIFVEAEGTDALEGTPLVRIIAPDPPERSELTVRNETGVADVRIRPLWREWKLKVTIKYDADQFTDQDVVNLLARAGVQVGIQEGRPFSKKSCGMGFGTFRIGDKDE